MLPKLDNLIKINGFIIVYKNLHWERHCRGCRAIVVCKHTVSLVVIGVKYDEG